MAKAKKKATSKSNGARVNKSAWIRSQSSSLSAKALVSKAKSQGIKLSLAQIYTARSTAKRQAAAKRGNGAGASRSVSRGAARSVGRVTPISNDLRKQFMLLAVRVGIDEAQRLLDSIVDIETGNS